MSDFIQEYLKNRSPTYKKAVETATSANMIEDIMKAHGGQMAGNASSIGSAMLNSGHAPLMDQGMKMLSKAQEIDASRRAAAAQASRFTNRQKDTMRLSDGNMYSVNTMGNGYGNIISTVIGPAEPDYYEKLDINNEKIQVDRNAPVGPYQYSNGDVLSQGGTVVRKGGTGEPAPVPGAGFNTAGREVDVANTGSDFVRSDAPDMVKRQNANRTYSDLERDENGQVVNSFQPGGSDWRAGVERNGPEPVRRAGESDAMARKRWTAWSESVDFLQKDSLAKAESFIPDYKVVDEQFTKETEMLAALEVLERDTTHLNSGRIAKFAQSGLWGAKLVDVFGPDLGALEAKMLPVKAKIASDTIILLKASAGGIGNISNEEMQLFMNSMAALNSTQTVGDLMLAYQMVRDTYRNRSKKAREGFQRKYQKNMNAYERPSSSYLTDRESRATVKSMEESFDRSYKLGKDSYGPIEAMGKDAFRRSYGYLSGQWDKFVEWDRTEFTPRMLGQDKIGVSPNAMEGVEITDEMIAEMAKAYGISISEALDIADEMRKADPKAGTSRSYPVTGGGY